LQEVLLVLELLPKARLSVLGVPSLVEMHRWPTARVCQMSELELKMLYPV
jgi:hypothetical protein